MFASVRYALTARCCSFTHPANINTNICIGAFNIRYPFQMAETRPDARGLGPANLLSALALMLGWVLEQDGVIQNFFRLGRHRMRSDNYRLLRERSFKAWTAATAA